MREQRSPSALPGRYHFQGFRVLLDGQPTVVEQRKRNRKFLERVDFVGIRLELVEWILDIRERSGGFQVVVIDDRELTENARSYASRPAVHTVSKLRLYRGRRARHQRVTPAGRLCAEFDSERLNCRWHDSSEQQAPQESNPRTSRATARERLAIFAACQRVDRHSVLSAVRGWLRFGLQSTMSRQFLTRDTGATYQRIAMKGTDRCQFRSPTP